MFRFLVCIGTLLGASFGCTAQSAINDYNIVWNTQSKNASESMPVGGGSIGANLWVENNEVLLYFSGSGAFDENNTLLKGGRLRIRLFPNPFENGTFRQELDLQKGSANIKAQNKKGAVELRVWVSVFQPVIHIEISSTTPVKAAAIYESWRFADRPQLGKENNANSWKWAGHVNVVTQKDVTRFENNSILFYHRNTDSTVFDAAVAQQKLDAVKQQLFNPLKQLTSGGLIRGRDFVAGATSEGLYANTLFKSRSLQSRKAAKHQELQIILHSRQTNSLNNWLQELQQLVQKNRASGNDRTATMQWWRQFWNRSYICIHPGKKDATDTAWQIGRNYQLFRYLLAANAYGSYPTKFNGGLFTVDPVFTDSTIKGTPDHRNWGGGTFTAQNQRLVYWPMLKSGDADMMKTQFDFYNRLLTTAELRSRVYWGHAGANFNEQIENFGLPNPTEYGWKRPEGFDPGMEYNAWLEYEWDTVLEFCMMLLEANDYEGLNIEPYLPLIKSCLVFFDEHYQYLAKKRGNKTLDQEGHLVLYPGSGAETFKLAYNASSTIAALRSVTQKLLSASVPLTDSEKNYFEGFLKRIPPIPYMQYRGKTTIAPAQVWARVNNTESSMLYPVFPWGLFGIGRAGLDTAINTYQLDTFALKFRSATGWKQDNIFAARLGLTDEARRLTILKLKDSGRRFPAFWGPGYDWVPDHNWGGSGMIGLQEMLLQVVADKIYLFPAWPKEWDVSFRLHAPQQTTVTGILKNGKLTALKVLPQSREKDVVNLLR
ncbi:hypothetical protein A8C56_04080 [Niabella ginsenosidivorans]|uniref:DUF5703 domain-containing protein n=1 Tax=Niabella ginsenosidivorans TaxID=1176587 RepID=A0A1A9I7X5_9BACT|nr:DUF5703 domain-containing protein [Niabella ginsenosidivorans]ANH83693.1 hypothetical protein A8C56_04080 [Niabella ginsenosidivorans]